MFSARKIEFEQNSFFEHLLCNVCFVFTPSLAFIEKLIKAGKPDSSNLISYFLATFARRLLIFNPIFEIFSHDFKRSITSSVLRLL